MAAAAAVKSQAIDSVAHRRNYNETETAFITKLSQRVPFLNCALLIVDIFPFLSLIL
jgi:hypothetical protein